MKLFEMITTQYGESYVRAYCWAEDESAARAMFAQKFPDYCLRRDGVAELFSGESPAFISQLSDSGFDCPGSPR